MTPKISLFFAAALLAAPVIATAQLAPVIEVNFDSAAQWEQSSHVLVGGATVGVTPGVSGRAGDYALDLSKNTTMGSTAKQDYAFIYSGANPLNNSKSFTLTGWYNSASAPGNGARLLNIGPVQVFFNNSEIFLDVNGKRSNFGDQRFLGVNTWTFFAISYDSGATSDNVKFYVGSSTADAILVRQFDMDGGAVIVNSNNARLNIGGRADGDYNFKGLMDNIRVFSDTEGSGGVLDLDTIRAIRASDLNPVPEPSTTALLIVCFAAAFAAMRMRRRR